jgi:phosphoribosyl 1,2-cyclic phosphodiesterase
MENDNFLVTFRGVRGSIPTPLSPQQVEDKLLKALELARPEDLKNDASRKIFLATLEPEIGGCIGGNSSCVQLQVGGQNLIFDAGTGLRSLGLEWVRDKFGTGEGLANLFLSHTHWDHINGIPFFVPFYIKGNHFTVFCPFEDIKDRLETQQSQRFFPVPLEGFSATLEFPDMSQKTQHELGDIRVTWKEMDHPGKCYAYRVDYKGKSCIYATDAEYKNLAKEDLQPTIDFFRDADLLIFDAQYTFMEGLEKRDWGHSSAFIGVDLAVDANVKCIAFYHHDPTYNDFKLMEIFEQAKCYIKSIAPESKLELIMAREDLTLDLMQK